MKIILTKEHAKENTLKELIDLPIEFFENLIISRAAGILGATAMDINSLNYQIKPDPQGGLKMEPRIDE